MPQDMAFPVLAVAASAGFVLGFLLGWVVRKTGTVREDGEAGRVQQNYQDLSREMARTQEELSRKREISTKIPLIVRRLSGRLDPSTIPAMAVRFTTDFFHASQVGFFGPAEGEKFTMIEGVGFPTGWKGNIRLSPDEGMLGMALQNMIILTRDEYLTTRGRWPVGIHTLEKNGVTPDLVAPVISDSKLLGALVVASSSVRISDESPYASMLADLVANAFQNATAIESVEQSAAIDSLTKIFTRRHFAQQFEMEIRRARNYTHPLSLFLFDIDHFKKVNDTYGHPAGDLILMKLGQILRQSVRSSDFTARYGGEEFAVVMTSANKEQAFTFAENLRMIIGESEMRIPGQEAPLRVTISGGVASFPADGASTTDLIRSADEALYEAKQTGRDRIVRARSVGLDGKPLSQG